MTNYENIMKEKEQEFENLSAYAKEKEAAHNKEMEEIQDELLRIQGEYRMLSKLMEQEAEKAASAEKVEDADVENVEAE